VKRTLKYATHMVGVGLVGFAAWQVGGPDRAATPDYRWKEIQLPDGSWCADSLITACVSPSGQVNIPRGEAAETLSAYYKIRRHIPGAEPLDVLGYETSRGTPVYTNEVAGELSARGTLDLMLDGTGLEARYFPNGIAVRPRK
jgi:hypothetical protein